MTNDTCYTNVQTNTTLTTTHSVIDAVTYLQYFSSDRSHMYNTQTKQWNAPPPTYDCINSIRQHDSRNNIDNQDNDDADYDYDSTRCHQDNENNDGIGDAIQQEYQKGKGNLIRYMTISQVDIDESTLSASASFQQSKEQQKEIDDENIHITTTTNNIIIKTTSSTGRVNNIHNAASSPRTGSSPFGCIYSLSQLKQRFGS
jgi:hypothetical protein